MSARIARMAVVAAASVLALAACGQGATVDQAAVDKAVAEALAAKETASPSPSATASETPSASTETEAAETSEADTVDFRMPNFEGMVLQDAQNKVQTYGIFFSTSHDLRGSRMQLLDANWKVCDQTPKAGTRISGDALDFEGKFDFGSVKLSEDCPS